MYTKRGPELKNLTLSYKQYNGNFYRSIKRTSGLNGLASQKNAYSILTLVFALLQNFLNY